MSDMFVYCRMLKDQEHLFSENGLECCCIFPLKKCKVMELFSGNFKIACSGDGTIFTADNPEDCRSWFQAIREAVELHVQCRKTLRKLSSNRKPMRWDGFSGYCKQSIWYLCSISAKSTSKSWNRKMIIFGCFAAKQLVPSNHQRHELTCGRFVIWIVWKQIGAHGRMHRL